MPAAPSVLSAAFPGADRRASVPPVRGGLAHSIDFPGHDGVLDGHVLAIQAGNKPFSWSFRLMIASIAKRLATFTLSPLRKSDLHKKGRSQSKSG